MDKIYTTETRIDLRKNPELAKYLNCYSIDYNKLYRKMWHQMAAKDFSAKYSSPSKYITHICKEYGVLKRTANTIYHSIIGRQNALLALKKTELNNLQYKVEKVSSDIEKLKKEINSLKPIVTKNEADEKELKKYRSLKNKLYQKQKRLNRYNQRVVILEEIIKEKKYDLCFGSKKAYKAQWFLKENKYSSHEKWYNSFVKQRDKNIEFLGSKDEACGNQLCQLTYDPTNDNFSIKLRKENNYFMTTKYVEIKSLNFKYLKDELRGICLSRTDKTAERKPLSFRFKRLKNRWYLQVMFPITKTPATRNNNGVIGLDFNNGFIEGTETDKAGNMVRQYHFDLKYHGCGNKAKSEMAETVAKIVNIAVSRGKDIAIEKLKFGKKKAKVGKNKAYNKMIHTLDFSRYTDDLVNACHRKQVGLIQVNPAYTSIVGAGKYGKKKKLNKHQAASFVIARLGQGYTDRYNKHKTVA